MIIEESQLDKNIHEVANVDKREFFIELRKRLHNDVDSIFNCTTKECKIIALSNIGYGLEPIREALGQDPEYPTQKLIVVKPKVNTTSIEYVKKWAEQNGYPELVLKKDEIIVKSISSGKDSWDNAISWSTMSPPYQDNFRDIINAIAER